MIRKHENPDIVPEIGEKPEIPTNILRSGENLEIPAKIGRFGRLAQELGIFSPINHKKPKTPIYIKDKSLRR